MSQRGCAINTSAETLYLDHISPLASLLNIPLIVTDEKNAQLTAKYYPEVKLQYWPDLDRRLQELADHFDLLIGCDYWPPQLKEVFRSLFHKEMRLMLCPHGQSDKGYGAPSLAPYADHDNVLLYGDLMQEMLSDLKLWDSIASPKQVGNFRLHYYQKHRDRLLLDAEREIFSALRPSNKTLLYAPTWKDGDGSTTFFDCVEKLFEETPSDWNVIVKIHPLLPARDPLLFYQLSLLEESHRHFVLVHEFPPVYPILEKIDAYLGDYSSIGYDLLAFQKPMFFLTHPHLPPARLHTCGKVLDSSKHLFHSIEQGLPEAEAFRPQQEALYRKAFANIPEELAYGMV